MDDGVIYPTPDDLFGFKPDVFEGWLWKKDAGVYVSLIVSLKPGRGFFRGLVESILAAGYTVKIPNPLGDMQRIVRKNGYVKSVEYDDDMGEDVEIWAKKPEAPAALK